MGKIIGGAVVGYLTVFVTVFVLFSAAYVLLGTSGSFQPGSWDVTMAWLVISIVVGILAAMPGGYLCAVIAKDARGTYLLAGIVIVLGIVFAVIALSGTPREAAPAVRPETVPLLQAMQYASQPVWLSIINPLLGAIGVLLGGRLRKTG